MKDNLFNNKFTSLDLVKVALLVVSLFSTWRIMSLITPDGPFAIVRILAAVVVVEGAFVAFERATANSKTEWQITLATVGFFCSLAVITIYLALTGFLEFGGPALLATQVGMWAGIAWSVREVVMVIALIVTAAWIAGLATIARLFALADPDKQNELQKNQLDGDVKTEANQALKQALLIATPEIAIRRALLTIDKDYGKEFTPSELAVTKVNVEARLREHYQTKSAPAAPALTATAPATATPAASAPAPSARPVRPITMAPIPATPLAAGGNGNGNGHHPTP